MGWREDDNGETEKGQNVVQLEPGVLRMTQSLGRQQYESWVYYGDILPIFCHVIPNTVTTTAPFTNMV